MRPGEREISTESTEVLNILFCRLADELRAEQENAQHCEKNRRSLECQVNDTQMIFMIHDH